MFLPDELLLHNENADCVQCAQNKMLELIIEKSLGTKMMLLNTINTGQ